MKKSIKYLFILPFFFIGCVDSLEDWNKDVKRATAVPADMLFSSAVKSMVDILATPNVNSNNFRLFVQHWTTTQYLDEPRYVLTTRLIPQNFWDALYRDVLIDLQEAQKILDSDNLTAADVTKGRKAQIEVISVLAWSILVNTFGDIPYSEALNSDEPLPKYDDAATIYADLLRRLDAAIVDLNAVGIGYSGATDVLYQNGSNKAVWLKFANSIKLKIAMAIVDHPASKTIAETAIQEASENVFTSNADNAIFRYLGSAPNNNPVATNANGLLTSRRDFVGANTLVDLLVERKDTVRLSSFFAPIGDYKEETHKTLDVIYNGGIYGYQNNPITPFSQVSARIMALDAPYVLIDYAEVSFLLAEAVSRGIITGDAGDLYEAGIRASFAYWGGAAASVEADKYLALPEVAWDDTKWKELIGTEMWIALFDRGWDSWLHWRRLDFPQLKSPNDITPPSGQDPPVTPLEIPKRLIYPVNQSTVNGPATEAAAAKIGGDLATTKLFWDVN
jgi:hypothetical protein